MLDTIKKAELWELLDSTGATAAPPFADLLAHAALSRLRGFEFARIGYINNGVSVDPDRLGPQNEILPIDAQMLRQHVSAETSTQFEIDGLDAIFSVNYVSGLSGTELPKVMEFCHGSLRSGGLMLHTFEFVIEDHPSEHWTNRFQMLRRLMTDGRFLPMGNVMEDLNFCCSSATMPDFELYRRRKVAPAMDPLRRRAQSVAMIVAARKI